MKFILLYGPPATGKLTIAKELQKKTNFKLLHNHMIVDLIDSIDEERTPEFFALYEKLLTEVINYAIGRNVDLINTFVYGHGIDDDLMRMLKKTVVTSGGEMYIVQITANKEELLKRVAEPSRKEFNKLSTTEKLISMMERYDMFTPFEETDLSIDNTDKTAKDVAKDVLNFIEK